MIRVNGKFLYRKGPAGAPTMPYLDSLPYRPEKEMLKAFDGAAHEMPYKRKLAKNLKQYRVNGTPRDVGEIPRRYVLRYILQQQPVTYNALWEVLKKQKDVPLDSMTHMRQVVKMARHEDWVYIEKDQEGNEMTLNLKQDRIHDVQEMLREQSETERMIAEQKTAEETQLNEEKQVEIEEIASMHVENLHRQLVEIAEKLKKYNANAYSTLPYVMKDGSCNFFWYRKEGIP